MFRAISHLLFGGEEEEPEDVSAVEPVDEGWLVVPHPDTTSPEQNEHLTGESNIPDLHIQSASKLDPETEPIQQSSPSDIHGTSSIVSQPRYVPEAAQLTCIHKTKSWCERHLASRHTLERQNRARQGAPRQTFNLQQPTQRHLSH